ncbi:MAG TPA: diguanylate cyclase [Arenicellales bacterium]|nr:diguanylate cyclase [Arenicellales bacterium]
MLRFTGKFDFSRFRYFLVLTFLAALAVTAGAAYVSGEMRWVGAITHAAMIALLVGAGAGLGSGTESTKRPASAATSISPANDESGVTSLPAASDQRMDSLEEQGITVKLLELTALGDRYGNVFSVAMIGVDHLEEIEQRYDAAVVGELLDKVSSALAHTLRMPDRVGDFDHGTYLVVLPETGLKGAIRIAERLRGAVSRLDVPVSGRIRIHTTASLGVTSYRRGDDLHSLVQRAAKALREAQNQGYNRVLPDMAA